MRAVAKRYRRLQCVIVAETVFGHAAPIHFALKGGIGRQTLVEVAGYFVHVALAVEAEERAEIGRADEIDEIKIIAHARWALQYLRPHMHVVVVGAKRGADLQLRLR